MTRHSDRVWYNASQEAASISWYNPNATFTADYGIPDRVFAGPGFFDGFDNFPGSKWSWQLNFGHSFGQPGGLENALEVAQIVMDKVQDKLESFEIGNEPDIMWVPGHRPQTYTLQEYVDEWNSYADAASERVLKGNPYGLEEVRFFQAMTNAMHFERWTL